MNPHKPLIYKGRAIVPSPFCCGDPANKAVQAHPWLRVAFNEWECPICDATGRI